ncbi:hypothetical protein F5884DRAFT_886007 [Xylogone sp. PMI_703]|nr:hypothetical protein F5884DRAFT_886007 [Xylogone sp. PMI_703]
MLRHIEHSRAPMASFSFENHNKSPNKESNRERWTTPPNRPVLKAWQFSFAGLNQGLKRQGSPLTDDLHSKRHQSIPPQSDPTTRSISSLRLRSPIQFSSLDTVREIPKTTVIDEDDETDSTPLDVLLKKTDIRAPRRHDEKEYDAKALLPSHSISYNERPPSNYVSQWLHSIPTSQKSPEIIDLCTPQSERMSKSKEATEAARFTPRLHETEKNNSLQRVVQPDQQRVQKVVEQEHQIKVEEAHQDGRQKQLLAESNPQIKMLMQEIALLKQQNTARIEVERKRAAEKAENERKEEQRKAEEKKDEKEKARAKIAEGVRSLQARLEARKQEAASLIPSKAQPTKNRKAREPANAPQRSKPSSKSAHNKKGSEPTTDKRLASRPKPVTSRSRKKPDSGKLVSVVEEHQPSGTPPERPTPHKEPEEEHHSEDHITNPPDHSLSETQQIIESLSLDAGNITKSDYVRGETLPKSTDPISTPEISNGESDKKAAKPGPSGSTDKDRESVDLGVQQLSENDSNTCKVDGGIKFANGNLKQPNEQCPTTTQGSHINEKGAVRDLSDIEKRKKRLEDNRRYKGKALAKAYEQRLRDEAKTSGTPLDEKELQKKLEDYMKQRQERLNERDSEKQKQLDQDHADSLDMEIEKMVSNTDYNNSEIETRNERIRQAQESLLALGEKRNSRYAHIAAVKSIDDLQDDSEQSGEDPDDDTAITVTKLSEAIATIQPVSEHNIPARVKEMEINGLEITCRESSEHLDNSVRQHQENPESQNQDDGHQLQLPTPPESCTSIQFTFDASGHEWVRMYMVMQDRSHEDEEVDPEFMSMFPTREDANRFAISHINQYRDASPRQFLSVIEKYQDDLYQGIVKIDEQHSIMIYVTSIFKSPSELSDIDLCAIPRRFPEKSFLLFQTLVSKTTAGEGNNPTIHEACSPIPGMHFSMRDLANKKASDYLIALIKPKDQKIDNIVEFAKEGGWASMIKERLKECDEKGECFDGDIEAEPGTLQWLPYIRIRVWVEPYIMQGPLN